MNLYSLPTLISCLYAFGLALFVLSQGRRQLPNGAFALSMTSVSIMEFGNFMALNASRPLESLFWGRISLVGCCFIPANWSLFSMVFTKTKHERLLKKFKVILLVTYALGFYFLIFIPSDQFITLPASQLKRSDLFLLGSIGQVFTIFLLLAISFILVNLETIYRNSEGVQRWRIKYSIIGIFAAFSYYIYVISKAMLFHVVSLAYLPVGSLVILICSGLLTFSFIRHRLINIDIFISRQVIYGSISLIIISLYLILVGFIGQLVKILGLSFNQVFYPVFVLLSLVVLASLILSEKNRTIIKKYIDRHFYKNRFDYRFEWIELTNRISSIFDLKELLERFMDLVAETMCVSEVSVWLYDDEAQKFNLSGYRNIYLSESGWSIAEDDPLIKYLRNKPEPLSTISKSSDNKEAEELYNQHQQKFFNKLRAHTLSPLMVKDKLIGFITLGEEVTGEIYNYEDYDILKVMCNQVANVILNIKLSKRLELAREMELMNKISSFVLHDLKNFISMLSLAVQNAPRNMDNPEFQKDLLETISKAIENMKGLMGRMSSLPKEMVFNKTQTNLVELLKYTTKKLKLGKNGIKLIENYADLPMLGLDQEKIQSVIQNLIINAQESLGDKGTILISAFADNKNAVIEVKDDGPGISREFLKEKLFKPFQTTKKKGLGIGLYQCKKIIEAHGGKIEVESEEKKGTQFKVYLPVNS